MPEGQAEGNPKKRKGLLKLLIVLITVVLCLGGGALLVLGPPAALFTPRRLMLGRLPSKHRDGGPDEVRSILIQKDGFMVATGHGIAKYVFNVGTPKLKQEFTTDDGLPSDNCYLLLVDALGGIWAATETGVAYLAEDGKRWQAYPFELNDMVLSADGKRVWVGTPSGLSTASIVERKWVAYKRRGVLRVFPHPLTESVWCRVVVPSRCSCGRKVLISRFDLAEGNWIDLPRTQRCPHVSAAKLHWSEETSQLWMLAGCNPPWVYDESTLETRTWPVEQHWERRQGQTVLYWEWFGDMAPAPDGSGDMWFATTAGLWRYVHTEDRWEGHLAHNKDPCGEALLAISTNGRHIAWACEEMVAVYDLNLKKWTPLWKGSTDDPIGCGALAFTPDGAYLWCLGGDRVIVWSVASGKTTILTKKQRPDLAEAHGIWFDTRRKRALLATHRGVVCTDYSGRLTATLKRATCPLPLPVREIVISPDGREVWCLMGDPHHHQGATTGRAAVLDTQTGAWTEVPAPGSKSILRDIIFLKDGTAWMSMDESGKDECGLRRRKPGEKKWTPVGKPFPDYCGEIVRFWESPDGKELWMHVDGCGLFRLKLAEGKLSQYAESTVRRYEGITGQFRIHTEYFIDDLRFTTDGKKVVCRSSLDEKKATIIDLATGKPNLTGKVRGLKLVPDPSRPRCFKIPEGSAPKVLKPNSVYYTVDPQKRVLTKRGAPSGARISTMTKGPKGRAWIAVPGRLLCLDPKTGELIKLGRSAVEKRKDEPQK